VGRPICTRKRLDNLNKLVFYALNGFVYEDDSQIAALLLRRSYGSKRPRVEITAAQTEG
jgi:Holliday junction resolvase RusA-like endonuclease